MGWNLFSEVGEDAAGARCECLGRSRDTGAFIRPVRAVNSGTHKRKKRRGRSKERDLMVMLRQGEVAGREIGYKMNLLHSYF